MTEIGLVILALLLRIPFLNQSLWLDEALEGLAMQGKMGTLASYILYDFQPPLYHGILYLWTRIAGTSEIALRIPSLLAGIGVVLIGAKLAEFIAGKKAALITGLLLATNPLLIYYSVEGRTYMLTTFFVTLSFYALLRSKKLLFALATIGIVWTSYLGALVVIAQGLYLLYHKKWSTLLPLVLGASTILFWLPSFFSSLGIGQSTLVSSPAWASVVGELTWKSLPLTWVKFVMGRISFDNKVFYAAIVAYVALLHGYILKNYKPKTLVLLWIFFPLALGLVITYFIPVYQFFRVLFVLPAYFILLGAATAQHPNGHNLALVLVGAQLIFFGVYAFTPRFHHEDWRAMVATYGTTATYAFPSLNQNAPLLYYNVPRANTYEPKVSLPATLPPQIVYVRYAEELFDAAGAGRAQLLQGGYTKASEVTYPGLAVEIYERNNH